MNNTNNIASDLFYKIRSRFTGLKLGAATGEITIQPEEARFFDFDYMEGENPIGHVSISLAEPNSMKVYFSHDITENMTNMQKHNWYGFLKELRIFAKRRLLSFDTRDVAKDNLDRRDYEFLSKNAIENTIGESVMKESSMYGTKHTSYQKLLDTRLIIKHKKKLDDDIAPGARSRNISALFVENQDGERFKYPFVHLAGARAMQRHVANGGLPYDEIGNSIIGMSEEIAQLKSFNNYVVRNDLMNSDTNAIVERGSSALTELRKKLDGLSKQKHYEAYKENFQIRQAVEIPEDIAADYTEKFTVKNFNDNIKEAFPVIYRLMKEAEDNAMLEYDDVLSLSEVSEEEAPETKSVNPLEDYESWVMELGEDEDEDLEEFNSPAKGTDQVDKHSDDSEAKTHKVNVQEVAEFIHSFYDKQSKTFPKGPEGVCTMVGKRFGEQAENAARKMVERLAPQQSLTDDQELANQETDELDSISKLAGISGAEPLA